jgi:hypothetical protein
VARDPRARADGARPHGRAGRAKRAACEGGRTDLRAVDVVGGVDDSRRCMLMGGRDTDYVLVPIEKAEEAMEVLVQDGWLTA